MKRWRVTANFFPDRHSREKGKQASQTFTVDVDGKLSRDAAKAAKKILKPEIPAGFNLFIVFVDEIKE